MNENIDPEKKIRGKHLTRTLKRIVEAEQTMLLVALIVLFVLGTILSPVFLTLKNIMNVFRSAALVSISGFGIVMILLIGEIDLSIGSMQAVAGLVAVTVLNRTGNIVVSLLATLAVGALIGLTNGLLVTRLKIKSLIATLGMLSVLRGSVMVLTQAKSIQAGVKGFQQIGVGYIGPFPIAVIIALVLAVIVYYLLEHTAFGRYIYAIGGSNNAARLSGLPVENIKLIVFVIVGVVTMLSGFILAARMNSAQPSAGTGFEMEVIASVILGGVSLEGGVGKISGAIIGILILSILSNILILLNISSFYHEVARGIVIILAVYLDGRRKQNLSKRLLST